MQNKRSLAMTRKRPEIAIRYEVYRNRAMQKGKTRDQILINTDKKMRQGVGEREERR